MRKTLAERMVVELRRLGVELPENYIPSVLRDDETARLNYLSGNVGPVWELGYLNGRNRPIPGDVPWEYNGKKGTVISSSVPLTLLLKHRAKLYLETYTNDNDCSHKGELRVYFA